MLLKTWINQAALELELSEVLYLAKNILDINLINLEIELKILAQKSLNEALQLRKNGMPLAKIIEKKEFYESYFLTNVHTLDPRSETEYIIEKIENKPRTVLELGVGTGCLILSILQKFPKARGVGVDISEEALLIASENAKILNLQKKVNWIKNDWANDISGDFDLIVCNPPYVEKEAQLSKETLNDPHLALFGNAETYLKIMDSLKNIKFKQMIFEVPAILLSQVLEILKKYVIKYEEIYNSNIFMVSIFPV